VPNNETKETLQPSTSIDRLVREYLAQYGAAYHQDVSPAQAKLYALHLRDISPERLVPALRRALDVCRFFPSIAEIRMLAGADEKQQIKQEQAQDELEAKKAWDTLQNYIALWGADLHPSLHAGKWKKPPELTAATGYAVRQCGGYYKVATATVENVHFIRRDFLQAFQYYRETGALAAPSREEAKRLLGKVQEWTKKLPPVNP
jgi:hypothetical protein